MFIVVTGMILFSCASGDPEEIFEQGMNDSEIIQNFQGETFTYMCTEREGRLEINPYDQAEDSYMSDMLKTRYEDVKKKYNINIDFKRNDGNLAINFSAGMGWADLYDDRSDSIFPLLNAGLLLPLNLVGSFEENIDSGMWGSIPSLNFFLRGGEYYAFQSGFHGIPFVHMNALLYANQTVLHKYGFNVFDLIENGSWTWKTFENVLTTIGNNYEDSSMETGFVISTSFPNYFTTAAIISNNGQFVKVDESGRRIFNMDSPECVEAIDWVTHLITDDIVTYGDNSGYKGSTGASYQFPRFVDNKIAFWCEYSYVGTVDKSGFMFNDVDFAIVPCPCGPSGTYGEWKGCVGYADRYFCMPITADTDLVDAVLYDIYKPLGEDKYQWRSLYAQTVFMYEKSADFYFQMYDNAVPDYYTSTATFAYGSVVSGKRSVSSALEAAKDVIQSSLDEYFNKYIK